MVRGDMKKAAQKARQRRVMAGLDGCAADGAVSL